MPLPWGAALRLPIALADSLTIVYGIRWVYSKRRDRVKRAVNRNLEIGHVTLLPLEPAVSR